MTRAPVVLQVFARPDTTRRLIDILREARPPRLFVVADAPREDVAGEAERCAAARAAIERVDWPCDVLTDFAERNLGPRLRPETGFDWVFSQAESAIVLDDDCLPHPSFFAFCDELLDRYGDDERVLSVTGDNFQFGRRVGDASYYFSRYPHGWGWATWRRAWAGHDSGMAEWPRLRDEGWLASRLPDPAAVSYWTWTFERAYRGEGGWDAAWALSCWRAGGLTAVPNTNLVTNTGFDETASHTRPEQRGVFDDLPALEMEFPLVHPEAVEADARADAALERLGYSGNLSRMFERLRRRPVEEVR